MSLWRKVFVFVVLAICLARAYNEAFLDEEGKGREAPDKFNLTLQPYNLTTPNETETTAWGMRLFGRLMTPTPIVHRALSKMLYVLFDCGKCDPEVNGWEIRKYAKDAGAYTQIQRENYFKDHDYYAGGYFMINLQPNTKYMVRAVVSGAKTVPALGQTCKESVPPVEKLRVAKAAAAWFDVRWNEPGESCNGKYYYNFMYVSHDATEYYDTFFANNNTRFGVYWRNDSPGPRWVWDSLHPCPQYPDEICLFIGEHVRPESTYLIHVKATRFGNISWEEYGYFVNISVKSNTDWDAFPASFCPTTYDTVPLWIILLFIVLILIVIIIIVVVGELLRKQKKKAKGIEEGGAGKKKEKKTKKKKKGAA